MPTTRREFIERAASGSLIFGLLPVGLDRLSEFTVPEPGAKTAAAEKYDLTWATKLTAKHKGVFDVPEVDSAYGVWRASFWAGQYASTMGAAPKDIATVLVLRHHGLSLGMKQAFWDKYGLAKTLGAMHPVTGVATDRNPALLSSKRKEQPAQFDDWALDKFIEKGNTVLACAVALQFCAKMVAAKDKVSEEAALKTATAALLPGIIIQPSGVFAVLRAQEVGCAYIRAS